MCFRNAILNISHMLTSDFINLFHFIGHRRWWVVLYETFGWLFKRFWNFPYLCAVHFVFFSIYSFILVTRRFHSFPDCVFIKSRFVGVWSIVSNNSLFFHTVIPPRTWSFLSLFFRVLHKIWYFSIRNFENFTVFSYWVFFAHINRNIVLWPWIKTTLVSVEWDEITGFLIFAHAKDSWMI